MTSPPDLPPQTPSGKALTALFDRAITAHKAGDDDVAEKLYLELLSFRRDHSHTWTNLAVIRRKQRHMDVAAAMVFRAIDVGDESMALGHNLLNVLLSAHRADDAMRLGLVDPFGSMSDDRLNDEWRGRALKALGRPRSALRHYEKALKEENIRGEMYTDLAISLLAAGRYEEGWQAYRRRWEMKGLTKASFAMPEWDGQDLAGKSVLVSGEQGLGDMIWLSRFLPDLKALKPAKLVAVVRSPLVALYQSYGVFDEVFDRDTRDISVTDYWISGFDLARHFWPDDDLPTAALVPNVPKACRARAQTLLQSAEKFFKIGIVWGTSATSQIVRVKSVALSHMLPLTELPNVQLVSLYKGEGSREISEIGADGLILDAALYDRDLLDTAAVIDRLDLVITVDTAVAHLAASQGKPVWMLTPEPAFWYWNGVGETTPYYPSMRVIRQSRPGVWDDVFERVKNDLHRMFS